MPDQRSGRPSATTNVLDIVIMHNGDDRLFNPNQMALLSAVPHVFHWMLKPYAEWQSDISGNHGCVCYADNEGTIYLTIPELTRLAGLRLKPEEYAALVKKFGIRHMWHDDFYLQNGLALQPRHTV